MKLIVIAVALIFLTGWTLEETMQEVGAGIRNGVNNVGEAIKETPHAISKASNKIEDDIRNDCAENDTTCDADKKSNAQGD